MSKRLALVLVILAGLGIVAFAMWNSRLVTARPPEKPDTHSAQWADADSSTQHPATPQPVVHDRDYVIGTSTGGTFEDPTRGFGFTYPASGYVVEDRTSVYYKTSAYYDTGSSSVRVQVYGSDHERPAIILKNYGFEGDAGQGDTYEQLPLQVAGTSTTLNIRTEHFLDGSVSTVSGSVSLHHGKDFYYIGFPYQTSEQKATADLILQSFHF